MAGSEDHEDSQRLDFAYELWDGPLLVAGGYQLATARQLVDDEYPDKDIVVVFGRSFISNPDLVYRFKEGLDIAAYNRSLFYTSTGEGYVDYPFSPEYLAQQELYAST